PRARTVDRLPGCLDNGARLPGRVWQARERPLHLAAAVPAVRDPLHRPAQTVLPAAPRPARAALLLDLARLLQSRAHLRVGAAGISAAAVSAGAHARDRPSQAAQTKDAAPA